MPIAIQQGIGVVAKRPIANAVWVSPDKITNERHREYWNRLQQLDYEFLKGDTSEAIGVALRFTLSVPGVHTAIVGTAKAGRWEENAALANLGRLTIS